MLLYVNTDATVDLVITQPLTMIASDGGIGHPRNAGTYSRVLARYVRVQGALTLMDALRKMTLMPAQRLERATPAARQKGRLQEGVDADVVIFDPATIQDRSTYEAPMKPSVGVRLYIDGAPQRTAGRMAALLREKANAAFRQRGIEAKLYGATSVVHVYLGAIDAAGRADPSSPPTADTSRLADPLAESIYKRLDLHLLHRGIASLRGEAFIPSAAHTEADIDQTVTATVDAVTALQKESALASR